MAITVQGILFAAKAQTKISGEGGFDIPLDAAEVVSHSYRNVVSDEPREDGSLVSDHVLRQPDGLVIEGLVSDYPLAIFGGGAAVGVVADLTGADRRRNSAYVQLLRAVEEQLLLDVVTSLAFFENMIAESLDVSQTRETAHALRFRLQLRSMQTARTTDSSTDLVDALPDGADLASPLSERGFQPAATL